MSKNYEPDSGFLEKLEWQLSSEFRRKNRLKSSAGKIIVSRRMAAVACMAGAVMMGVTVLKAADYIKDSWRKKIEIARAETDLKLSEVYQKSIEARAEKAEIRFSNGLVREDEYRLLNLASRRSELDVEKSRLNLEEVETSGQPPRDELYAPVVGGRDFVSERLAIEIEGIELDLEQLLVHWDRLKNLTENDLVSEDELNAVQSEIAGRDVMIDKIHKKLELRKRFVDGEVSAQEVEIEGRMTAAENNLHRAKSKVDLLNKRLARLKSLEDQAMIDPAELKQMQFALDAAQAELELAVLEKEVLEKVK